MLLLYAGGGRCSCRAGSGAAVGVGPARHTTLAAGGADRFRARAGSHAHHRLRGFQGHDAVLFGAVMAQYLARHVEVNHFVETVLQASGGAEIMRWRPRCGTRMIL